MKLDSNKQEMTRKIDERKNRSMGFEVDYQYFLTYFWPTVEKIAYELKHLNAHLVWTQIFSVIKGSANAHKKVYRKYLDSLEYFQ